MAMRDLNQLQRMLSQATDPEVAQAGRSELPAVGLLAATEARQRVETRAADAGEKGEPDPGNPSVADRYLNALQGIPAQQPAPQLPPQFAQSQPPQGIASMPPAAQPMPPQAQPPVQMMAGGGAVSNDMMYRPGIGYSAGRDRESVIMTLMAQGMSREEATRMAHMMSDPAAGQMNEFRGGGFIDKYADKGSVGPVDESLSPEELEAVEDPGILIEAVNWVKNNPGEAAVYGLDTAAFAAMAVPVAGWGASAALKGSSWALRAARALGPKVLKMFRNPVQTIGKKRLASGTRKIESKVDEVTDLESARRLYQSQPSRMRTTIRDGRVVQVPRTEADMVTNLGRRAVYPAVGLGVLGINRLIDSDDDENDSFPQEFGAKTDDGMSGAPAGPGGDVSLGADGVAPKDLQGEPLSEPDEGGKWGPLGGAGWGAVMRAGLELASGKGENLFPDIAEAGIAGMGEYERLTDREMAIEDRDTERLRQIESDYIARTRLEMDQAMQPFLERESEARAESYGRRGEITHANSSQVAERLLEQDGSLSVAPGDIAYLASLLVKYQDTDLAMEMYLESKGIPSDRKLSRNQATLNDILNSGDS